MVQLGLTELELYVVSISICYKVVSHLETSHNKSSFCVPVEKEHWHKERLEGNSPLCSKERILKSSISRMYGYVSCCTITNAMENSFHC